MDLFLIWYYITSNLMWIYAVWNIRFETTDFTMANYIVKNKTKPKNKKTNINRLRLNVANMLGKYKYKRANVVKYPKR